MHQIGRVVVVALADDCASHVRVGRRVPVLGVVAQAPHADRVVGPWVRRVQHVAAGRERILIRRTQHVAHERVPLVAFHEPDRPRVLGIRQRQGRGRPPLSGQVVAEHRDVDGVAPGVVAVEVERLVAFEQLVVRAGHVRPVEADLRPAR